MTRSVSNVNISSDSFLGLITKTNELLGALSNEIVTSSNSTAGSNTAGNVSVIGILSSNIVATPILRGGNSGNTATLTTLVVGHSNSTSSSNVRVVGYTANIGSNTLNITSNTTLNATSFTANVSTFAVISNTTIYVGNTSNPSLVTSGNNTYSHFNILGSNALINTAAFHVASVTRVVGNTVIAANSTSNTISIQGNNTTSNVTVVSNNITLTSDVTINGAAHSISGNVAFDSNTLFIDSVNNRVGIFTGAPQFALHVKNDNTSPVAVFEHVTQATRLDIASSNTYTGTNTVLFYAATGTQLRLSSNGAAGGSLFLAGNGNIGIANDTPGALVSIGNTRVYANGTFQTSGDLICSGDLYANIVFMGGSSQGTITATICPIVPPNTIYNASEPGPYSFLQFSNTVPQRIDVIPKAQGSGYQAVKYTLQVQDNENVDEVLMTEVSMIYGYGNAHSTQFGTIFTNTAFVEVSVGANSTDYWIQAAPTTAYLTSKGGQANLQFRGVRQKCK
jgi:hypothetical protein